MRKHDLSDTPNRERISDAERDIVTTQIINTDVIRSFIFLLANPIAVTIMSIILIPMNGAIKPPSP